MISDELRDGGAGDGRVPHPARVTTLVRPDATGPGHTADTDPRQGLTVDFYRRAAAPGEQALDTTLGGISALHRRAVAVGVLDRLELRPLAPGSRLHSPDAHAPAAWLYRRLIGGPVWCLIPAMPAGAATDRDALACWVTRWMFGGNFASLGDSRLAELVDFYGAVAVHDRTERRA